MSLVDEDVEKILMSSVERIFDAHDDAPAVDDGDDNGVDKRDNVDNSPIIETSDFLYARIGIALGLDDNEIASDTFRKGVDDLQALANQLGIRSVIEFINEEVKNNRYEASLNPFAFLRSKMLLLKDAENKLNNYRFGNKVDSGRQR